jgi:two-component system, NarL family, sensor kinase
MGVLQVLIVVLFIFLMVVLVVIVAVIYQRRQRRNSREKQLLQSQHTQAILQTQLEIQEQTLATISQEIHDNIGQVLSLAKLNLNTLLIQPAGKPKLDSTVQLVSKAISDLRDLSRSMHGDRIAELGLHESIANELKIIQNTRQFATGMQTTGSMYRLEQQQEMVLFRMVQEALHNAIKHSHAATISVHIDYQPDTLTLAVSDDGKGFAPEALQAAQKGIGLKSMQNRAVLIGASFSIASPASGGTLITIALSNNTGKITAT